MLWDMEKQEWFDPNKPKESVIVTEELTLSNPTITLDIQDVKVKQVETEVKAKASNFKRKSNSK